MSALFSLIHLGHVGNNAMVGLSKGMIFVAACSLVALLAACSPQDDQHQIAEKGSGLEMQVKQMSDIDSGYRSSEEDWATFLNCWSAAVERRSSEQGNPNPTRSISNKVIPRGTMEYEKNKKMLADAEAFLGLRLPKSYRDFEATTGGIWLVESAGPVESKGFYSHLSPIKDIGRFQLVDKLNWGAWHRAFEDVRGKVIAPDLYYRYGYKEDQSVAQDDSQFRWEHIDHLVKVGELAQGTVILLNPREVTMDGEWEAWTLSPTFGAMRFRSFAELMQYVAYEDHLKGGGVFVPSSKLLSTCAKHLRTAANVD